MPKYPNIVPFMTHREIAEQLGVSTMTVFNDIQSATCKIHAYLTKGDPDAEPIKVTRSSVNKKKRNKEITQMNLIDISKMDRAEVLSKLFNASKPQGLSFLHFTPEPMTTKQAQAILDQGSYYFDYLEGRVMKIKLAPGAIELDPFLYDRDNGQGAAARALGVGPLRRQ